MQVPYFTVDVFTDRVFGGNPLAVIPDARGLTTEQMQAIAREFNYSEQTFVLPPDDPAHTARVRIFTPVAEVPFAGHPNVGTAFALARLGAVFGKPVGDEMVFEEDAGPVRATVLRRDGEPVGASIAAPRPLELGPEVPGGLLARCVGLPPSAFAAAAHPPRIASVGLPFVFAELSSLEALAAAHPEPTAFARAAETVPKAALGFALHLWTRIGPGHLRARMFAPLDGVLEDPATGSAAGALGAMLAARGEGAEFTIEQGVEMGRPSRIDVRVSADTVTIAGPCVAVMAGTLTAAAPAGARPLSPGA